MLHLTKEMLAKLGRDEFGRQIGSCLEGGPHRTSISGLTGAAWCLDCSWDEGD